MSKEKEPTQKGNDVSEFYVMNNMLIRWSLKLESE